MIKREQLYEALYEYVTYCAIRGDKYYPFPEGLDIERLDMQHTVHGAVVTYDGEPFGIIKSKYTYPRTGEEMCQLIERVFKPITYELNHIA